MNPRTTWTLVALAAGLFAFIFFFERHLGRKGSDLSQARALPELAAVAVTSVQVRPAGQLEIRVDRTNHTWQLTKPIVYPAQSAAIAELLRALEQLDDRDRITAHELRSRRQADKEFGFDPPQYSLIIQQGEDRMQILVGRLTALKDQVFIQVVGKGGIFVTDAGVLQLIPKTPDDWRDTALVDLRELKFDRIAVTSSGKTFEIEWNSKGRLWRMIRPMEARADNPRIEDLLKKLQAVRVTQFVSDEPKADFDFYGLQSPALELALNRGTNPVVRLQFGKSPTNDPSQVYARRAGEASVLLVPDESISPWSAKHDDFRDRHLVALSPGMVDTVEVRGTESFTVQRLTNDLWQVVATNTFTADTALVHDLLGSLSALEVAQFVKYVVTPPDLPTYGLEPSSRQYIVRVASTNSASPGTNGVVAQLIFGAVQGDNIYARRADENSVYAVKLGDYQRLPYAGWQLRDRRIWGFTENDVSKVAVRQQGKTVELLRTGTNRWAFAPGSQGIINPFGVEETVHRLGELTAAAWVARGAGGPSRYGFSENPDRITIETKRGGKLSVEFGGVSRHGFPYGAVALDGQTWVFELSVALYHYIETYLSVAPSTP